MAGNLNANYSLTWGNNLFGISIDKTERVFYNPAVFTYRIILLTVKHLPSQISPPPTTLRFATGCSAIPRGGAPRKALAIFENINYFGIGWANGPSNPKIIGCFLYENDGWNTYE
jgi:hypothetical protein